MGLCFPTAFENDIVRNIGKNNCNDKGSVISYLNTNKKLDEIFIYGIPSVRARKFTTCHSKSYLN